MKVIYAILICLYLIGCEKNKYEKIETLDDSYFYNIKIGNVFLYEHDSINYRLRVTDTEDSTKIRYFTKEQVEQIIVLNGEKIYNMALYKSTDSINFTFQKYFSIVVSNNELRYSDDNITFVNMTYPVLEGKTWNGNKYNQIGEQDYEYGEIKSYKNYTNTVEVKQKFIDNFFFQNIEYEIFAQNLGLIEKVKIDFEKQQANTKAKGYKYKKVLIARY